MRPLDWNDLATVVAFVIVLAIMSYLVLKGS
jgi:hypothetical protein